MKTQQTLRAIALSSIVATTLVGIAAVGAGAATAATPAVTHGSASIQQASNSQQRIIIANQSNRDLDMTITLQDGSTLHSVVKPHTGWYPEGDYGDSAKSNTLTVKDTEGVAYTATFHYWGDWFLDSAQPTSRLSPTWHSGPFGGWDFR